MSTVMYVHRINKSGLQPLMRNLRKWGETKSILAQIELAPETEGDGWGDRLKLFEADRRAGGARWRRWEDMTVEVQIFERGPYYLLRTLHLPIAYMPGPEGSDRWRESYVQHPDLYLQRHRATRLVRYDNRVPIPSSERRNEKVADWLDAKITAGLYTVFHVVSLQDFELRLSRRLWARADAK